MLEIILLLCSFVLTYLYTPQAGPVPLARGADHGPRGDAEPRLRRRAQQPRHTQAAGC